MPESACTGAPIPRVALFVQVPVDITVIAYFVPFLYLFLTAWKHGRRWTTASGLDSTFIPPAGVSWLWLCELKLAGGGVPLAATARFFLVRAQRSR